MRRWLLLIGLLCLTAAFIKNPHECIDDCPYPENPSPPVKLHYLTGDWSVTETGTDADPLAAFGRRPIDDPWFIPLGGNYLDPARSTPHYGIDYTYPDYWSVGIPQPVYPVGPGIVVAVTTCPLCRASSKSGEPTWAMISAL